MADPKSETTLRNLVAVTFSHIDGRDLLAELHPRKTLDIKRRVDGVEKWFEGDWLSSLMQWRNQALRELAGVALPVPEYLGPTPRQIAAVERLRAGLKEISVLPHGEAQRRAWEVYRGQ